MYKKINQLKLTKTKVSLFQFKSSYFLNSKNMIKQASCYKSDVAFS